MSTLSAAQLYRLTVDAGMPERWRTVMVAVALGESGGRTDAMGDISLQTSKWGPSIGLWQVRSLKAELNTGGTRDASRLTDPGFNARSARTILGNGAPTPWTVYTTGAYRRHMGTAEAAARSGGAPVPGGAVPGGAVPVGLPGLPNPVDAAGDAVARALAGLATGADQIGGFFAALSARSTWVRVAQAIGGAGLVVGGLAWMGKDLVSPALDVAAGVIPQAKAVKAASAVQGAAKGTASG